MSEKESKPAPMKSLTPAFVKSFPEDARLQVLIEAYLQGDYGAIRVGATKLRQESAEPDVQRAAEELLRRISPHPILRWMYLATLVLIVAVGLYWMRRN